MDIISIVFIALGLSMDTFAVGVCEGLSRTKLRISFALSLALCFGFFQAGMAFVGYFAGSFFADFVYSFSNFIAFGLLAVIGGKMICNVIFPKKCNCYDRECSCDTRKRTGFFGLILLGIATSIDALAVGVNFAFLGNVDILFAAGIIGVTTFFVSFFGVYFGKLLGKYLAKYAELAGGIILIVIGIRILFGF